MDPGVTVRVGREVSLHARRRRHPSRENEIPPERSRLRRAPSTTPGAPFSAADTAPVHEPHTIPSMRRTASEVAVIASPPAPPRARRCRHAQDTRHGGAYFSDEVTSDDDDDESPARALSDDAFSPPAAGIRRPGASLPAPLAGDVLRKLARTPLLALHPLRAPPLASSSSARRRARRPSRTRESLAAARPFGTAPFVASTDRFAP